METGESIFMFTNKILKFPHKSILTSAMLKEVYEYPREFIQLMYKDYSDGIICGLDYSVTDGDLILSAGIFKLYEEFYFLNEDLNISELAEKNSLEEDNKIYNICLEKKTVNKEICLTENNFFVTFSEENKFPTLGSFIFTGRKNFNLPKLTDGDNPFKDIFRQSRFNLLDIPASDKSEATFHSLLFDLVTEFLLTKKNKTPFDYSILVQLQNQRAISLQTIKAYIVEENGTFNFQGRADLFKNFCKTLICSEFKVTTAQVAEQEKQSIFQRHDPLGRRI